jgi:hypothetical protein
MEPASSAPPTGFEGFLANNLSLLLIIVGCCCTGLVPGIVGIIGLTTAKDPNAKRNSLILTIAGAVLIVLDIIGTAVQLSMKK